MPTKSPSGDKKPTSNPLKNSKLPTKPASSLQDQPSGFATSVSPEEREQMIRETAYYLAEKDGFPEGQDEENWRRAEEQIEKMLKA